MPTTNDRRSYTELDDKFNDLHITITEGFTQLRCQYENLNQDIREIKVDVERVDHTVYGNGKEGLVTKVAKVKQKQTITWGILGTIGAAVIGVGFKLLVS